MRVHFRHGFVILLVAAIASPALGASGVSSVPAPETIEQLNRLLSQPMVQGYLRLVSNPSLSHAANRLVNSPRRLDLLFAELGFILFMLVFRAWRISRGGSWYRRLWTRFWTFGLYWAGALVGLPWAVLGEPFYRTIAAAFDVLWGMGK